MKQHITVEQLNELTQKQRRRLGKWALTKEGIDWHDRGAEYPLLSLGQMIEFLYDAAYIDVWIIGEAIIDNRDDICDLLWEHVKTSLNGLS